jgi:hypothetical protein
MFSTFCIQMFGFLVIVIIKTAAVWNVMACSLKDCYTRKGFEETCCLHIKGKRVTTNSQNFQNAK